MFADILNRWSLLMSDTTPEQIEKTEQAKKHKDGLNLTVDGGITISKQALWRTFVMIWVLGTGGGITYTRVENVRMAEQLVTLKTEQTAASEATTKQLLIFRSITDDLVNFLIEEKAQQKTQAGKKRYEEQIEKVRTKLRSPIGKLGNLMANPLAPLTTIYSANKEN